MNNEINVLVIARPEDNTPQGMSVTFPPSEGKLYMYHTDDNNYCLYFFLSDQKLEQDEVKELIFAMTAVGSGIEGLEDFCTDLECSEADIYANKIRSHSDWEDDYLIRLELDSGRFMNFKYIGFREGEHE